MVVAIVGALVIEREQLVRGLDLHYYRSDKHDFPQEAYCYAELRYDA